MQQPEEMALAKTVDEVERAAAAAVAKEDFEAAMAAMAKLRLAVDAFFDHVTVNTDDPHMFGTDLTDEYRRVATAFALDVDAVAALVANAVTASFMADDRKRAVLAEIERCRRSAAVTA